MITEVNIFFNVKCFIYSLKQLAYQSLNTVVKEREKANEEGYLLREAFLLSLLLKIGTLLSFPRSSFTMFFW